MFTSSRSLIDQPRDRRFNAEITDGLPERLPITKRGDIYLRMLLIQGAKSVVMTATRDEPCLKMGASTAREVGLAEGCRGAGQQECTNTLGDVRAGQALRCAPCERQAGAACSGEAGGHGPRAGIGWWGQIVDENCCLISCKT